MNKEKITIINKIKNFFNFNNRQGFLYTIILFYWIKSMVAYFVDFRGLGINNIWQFFTAIANPIFFTAILFFLLGFIKKSKFFYPLVFILYSIITILLVLNVVYYREAGSYVSFSLITGYSKVNQGTAAAGLTILRWHDLIYILDLFFLVVLILKKKFKIDKKPIQKNQIFLMLSSAILGLMSVFALSDTDRPQLIVRGFDDNYMVKYMGINFYTIQNSIETLHISQIKQSSKPTDIEKIRSYIKKNYVTANPEFFGKAKGKNVIVLHLESFQQSSINLKVNGQEVTPFLNSLFNSKDSISFDNFFHQVGQGKTSDAENMLENSIFGLPTGSVFIRYYANEFQSMPAILNQEQGYSTAVFHGNVGTFYNRQIAYKSLGYQNFFDASYYDVSGRKAESWGLKDKLFFQNSIPYLEKLQQPFYAKFLTVTNHLPYALDDVDKDPNFVTSQTNSESVNNYFVTNRYLDQSIKEFYDYLNKTGLIKNSIIILYGDHFGISNSDNKALATVLGDDPETWNAYNDLQMQRVPFIINMPGYEKGYVNHTFGGEIDVMPTLEHLLGVKTKDFIQFGQDLLNNKRSQFVVFRNEDFVTPDYTYTDGKIFNTQSGIQIDESMISDEEKEKIESLKNAAVKKLQYSDKVIYGDLLRFNKIKEFKTIYPQKYDYQKQATLDRLDKDNENLKSTSILSENGNKTTLPEYKTDAPEQNDPRTNTGRITITSDEEDHD
ncbi:MAG: LTA synthase family protein [Lactobacillaceae bacterium]|jgi:lipoteichoic acid synthase|nr:LTA synthase family protein [Lactobacillaceae bacterium]